MSEQIREQVSAFLDGELPSSETELLLKRLTRDGELRDSFGRYALIGEALRGSNHSLLRKGFESRVNLAIDGEPLPVMNPVPQTRASRWWRPFAGISVVAGVAAVAIIAMQQRSLVMPGNIPGSATMVDTSLVPGAAVPGAAVPVMASNHEAISYTVPAAATPVSAVLAARQAGRLTNYMFAHSKYSYGLGQRGVLADLLIQDDEQAAAASEPVKMVPVRVAP